MDIDCSTIQSFQELYISVQKSMEQVRTLGLGRLLSISLSNIQLNDKEWMNVKNGELLQALQDEEKNEDSFVWPISISTKLAVEWERQSLETESEFYKEMFLTADHFDIISDSIKPLYDHPGAAKFLDQLSDEEKEDIQEEALQLLVTLLRKGG